MTLVLAEYTHLLTEGCEWVHFLLEIKKQFEQHDKWVNNTMMELRVGDS